MHGLTPIDMPELSSTTAPSLTAAATPALTLRICGTPQDGRLVRLNGLKCTIGSDSKCTLRLRAPGVSPFHCLIVRGPERTIVRRWSDDTRLNGQEFTAAMLNFGDRLTVGSVEFEVVDGLGSALTPAPARNAAPQLAAVVPSVSEASLSSNGASATPRGDDRRAAAGPARARARRLLTRLREVRQENELNALRLARLEEEHRKLRDEAAANEQQRLSAEHERSVQLEERARSLLEAQRRELEQGAAQLEEDRAELQNDRASFAQAWAAFEQERSALESQRLLLQQELRTFEEHKHALTLERIDWQTDTSRAEADLAIRRDELDRRATALERQRLDHETARRRLEEDQRELAHRQEILQKSENELAERQRRIGDDELTLDRERNALAQDRAQLESARRELADEQAKLAAEWHNIETHRNQDQIIDDDLSRRLAVQAAELTESTERLNRVTKELEKQQALLEAARKELDEERAQWDSERERLLQDQEQELADLRLELSRSQAALREAESEQNRSPKSEEEVFSRLRSMSLLKTDVDNDQAGETLVAEEVTIEADDPQTDGVQSHVRATPQVLSNDPAPEDSASSAAAAQEKEDVESIDDYMAQLLKRVRGVGSAYQGPASQAPERPARAAQSVADSSSQPTSSPPIPVVEEVPAKLARRAPAPELSSDLAAMRELANLSARAAIDKHAYRNWGRAAFGKLTIALLAIGTGAGAVCFAPAPDSMLMYAGLSSFVVAVFWLLQAGILMNHVIKASRRNDQFIDTAESEHVDEASSEVVVESAAAEEDEFAPAELIHAHDGFPVPPRETFADQANEVVETDGEYRETPIAAAVYSADGGDVPPGENGDQETVVTGE